LAVSIKPNTVKSTFDHLRRIGFECISAHAEGFLKAVLGASPPVKRQGSPDGLRRSALKDVSSLNDRQKTKQHYGNFRVFLATKSFFRSLNI
jgi:hypothetical protein